MVIKNTKHTSTESKTTTTRRNRQRNRLHLQSTPNLHKTKQKPQLTHSQTPTTQSHKTTNTNHILPTRTQLLQNTSARNPSNKFTAKQASDDIIKLIDHLDVNQFYAMGVSSGGDILLHIATSHPNRIIAMVLDSTGHYFPKQGRDAASNWAPSNTDARATLGGEDDPQTQYNLVYILYYSTMVYKKF
jgi:pimeloyl-ACP methyl ester carboxylesterase